MQTNGNTFCFSTYSLIRIVIRALIKLYIINKNIGLVLFNLFLIFSINKLSIYIIYIKFIYY